MWRGRIQGLSGVEFEQLEAWKTAVMSVNQRIDKLRDDRTEVHAKAMEKISVQPALRAYYRGVRMELTHFSWAAWQSTVGWWRVLAA